MNHGDSNANAHPFSDHPLFENPWVIAHAAFMTLAFVVCYPLAIALPTRLKERRHVVISCLGTGFAAIGFVLGWGLGSPINGGVAEQQTHENIPMDDMQRRDGASLSTSPETYGITLNRSAHSAFSGVILLLLIIEAGCGVYANVMKSTAGQQLSPYTSVFSKVQQSWIPRLLPTVHSVLGKAFLLLAYIQIVLGLVLVAESCESEYFAQCMAHIIMGSAFLWYGTLSLLYLLAVFSLPRGSVPEYYESVLITVWGVINSFALHRWGTPWSHQDLQHASLGVLWWGGGALGLIINFQTWFPLLRDRNPLPAIVVALTGLAMSSHSQHHGFAIAVHKFFGMSLIGGAAARLIQIATRPAISIARHGIVDDDEEDMYLPRNRSLTAGQPSDIASTSLSASISTLGGFFASLGIMTAGMTFMAANENWLNIVTYYIDDASTYINFIVTLAFVWLIYVIALASLTKHPSALTDTKGYMMALSVDEHEEFRQANGPKPGRRHGRTSSSSSSSSIRPSEYLARRKSGLTESATGDISPGPNHKRTSWPIARTSWPAGTAVENRDSWFDGKIVSDPVSEIEEEREEVFTADIEMDGLLGGDKG